MKKFLAILLVFTLLFSFAACNKDDVNSGEESTSKQDVEQTVSGEEDTTKKKPRPETTTAAPFVNPNLTEPAGLFKIVGVDNYTLVSRAPNTSASSGKTTISKRYEYRNARSNDFVAEVSVGGFNFVLNEVAVKDFISNGWTVVGKNDANTVVEAGKEANVYMQNSKDETIKLNAKNKSANSVAVADCIVTGVNIAKTVSQRKWADFTIAGKANTATSSYLDYVKAFGNPKFINVTEIYDGNDYVSCKSTLVYEKSVGNETYSLSVHFDDVNDETSIFNCTVEVK